MVSIIIPAYNRGHKISEALKSIQEQTFPDWEAIVVDDGSTDDTVAVVEEFCRNDSRIVMLRHKLNRGAQAARNTGIKAARGEWIAFLDSDDQWLPESLELRLNVAIRENVPVVHSRANIVHPGKPMQLYDLPAWSGWIYKDVLSREGPVFQALLVKKEALERIGYLDEAVVAYQEWDTAILLAQYCHFGFEPKPTFIYDYSCQDSISRNSIQAGRGYEYIVHKHIKDILRYLGTGGLAYHYDVAAKWYHDGGDQKNARRCALLAIVFKCLSLARVKNRIKHPMKHKEVGI